MENQGYKEEINTMVNDSYVKTIKYLDFFKKSFKRSNNLGEIIC